MDQTRSSQEPTRLKRTSRRKSLQSIQLSKDGKLTRNEIEKENADEKAKEKVKEKGASEKRQMVIPEGKSKKESQQEKVARWLTSNDEDLNEDLEYWSLLAEQKQNSLDKANAENERLRYELEKLKEEMQLLKENSRQEIELVQHENELLRAENKHLQKLADEAEQLAMLINNASSDESDEKGESGSDREDGE